MTIKKTSFAGKSVNHSYRYKNETLSFVLQGSALTMTVLSKKT